MLEAVKTWAAMSVSGGVLAVILLICKPLYRRRLSKAWQYYIWLVALLRMALPFTPEVNLASLIRAAKITPASVTVAVSVPDSPAEASAPFRL